MDKFKLKTDLFKNGINFTQMLILIAIVVVSLILVKVIFKLSLFFIIKIPILVLVLWWLVSALRASLKQSNKTDDGEDKE